jgi:NAD+ synthase
VKLSPAVFDIDAPAVGAYRFIGNLVPSRRLLAAIIRKKMASSARNLFIEGVRGTDDGLTNRSLAAVYAKQRARVVVTFRYAEIHRLLVAGTAHKTEDLLGLFVKFGIDDMADVMPLKRLYRSHVVRIARALGVPEEVMARTPNPEMLPGVEDKYRDVLGVSAGDADLVLYGIEHGMVDADIAEGTGLPEAKVAELREVVGLTEHMRQPSLSPDPGI